MNDDSLDELDPVLRRGVEAWRAEEVDPAALSDIMARIAARPPRRPTRRRVLLPAVTAVLGAWILWWTPAAWAEATRFATTAGGETAGPTLDARRAAWRPVVIAHVLFTVAAYPVWLAAWAALHLAALLHLAGRERFPRTVRRIAPWCVGVGCLLYVVGGLIGEVWARGVFGMSMAPREPTGLISLVVASAWGVAVWRLPEGKRLLGAAALSAVAFWLMLDLWCGYLARALLGLDVVTLPRVLLGLLLLDLVFLAAGWGAIRRKSASG